MLGSGLKALTPKGEVMEIELETLSEKYVRDLAKMDAEIFADAWSENAYRDLLKHSYCHYLVAVTEGRPVGFAGMTVSLDEGDIDRVMVARDQRRSGIADLLMRELMKAKEEGLLAVAVTSQQFDGQILRQVVACIGVEGVTCYLALLSPSWVIHDRSRSIETCFIGTARD